jgi:hypothetical protein
VPLQFAYDRSAETGDVTLATAWARVDGFAWSRAAGEVRIEVGIYASAAAGAAKRPVVERTFVATGAAATQIVTAPNIQAAVYAYLKTLPFFAGAIDV